MASIGRCGGELASISTRNPAGFLGSCCGVNGQTIAHASRPLALNAAGRVYNRRSGRVQWAASARHASAWRPGAEPNGAGPTSSPAPSASPADPPPFNSRPIPGLDASRRAALTTQGLALEHALWLGRRGPNAPFLEHLRLALAANEVVRVAVRRTRRHLLGDLRDAIDASGVARVIHLSSSRMLVVRPEEVQG